MWKEWLNPYNRYNPLRALAWRERLEAIVRGELPAPLSVTIDPSNLCSTRCIWCKTAAFRQQHPQAMSPTVLMALPTFLKDWGVKSVALDGGEPLTHPKIVPFLRELKKCELEVELFTDGFALSDPGVAKAVQECCTWVSFSVDCSTQQMWMAVKKGPVEGYVRIHEAIAKLVGSRSTDQTPKVRATYLIHHLNYREMYQFAQTMNRLGVDEIFFSPAAIPNYQFGPGVCRTAEWHLREARKHFESDKLHIYGIIHKFERDWSRAIRFEKCVATPLGGVFAANQEFYVCGDRRGVKELSLGPFYPFDRFLRMWGSPEHREMIRRIVPKACPHCSLSTVNEAVQHMILEDEAALKFL